MCTEHYGDWSLHNHHFSGINDFLSLTAKLLKTLSLRYRWWFLVRRWCLKSLGGKTLLAEHWMAPINTKWPRSFMIRVRKPGFKFLLGLIYRKRNWNLVHSVLCKVAMHGSPWRCIRLSLLLDKPCNICFLPWVGKIINVDLFRRKSSVV